MKKTLYLFILFPCLIFGQLQDNSFWKGYGIENASGETLRDKIQQFALVKKDKMYLLRFFEQINMETGNIQLSSKIDTLTIKASNEGIRLMLKDKSFPITYNRSTKSFKIAVNDAFMPFKAIEQSLAVNKDIFKNKLISNTFYEVDDTTTTLSDKLLYNPSTNGTITYTKEYSSSTWTSDFIIVNLFGNIFLKGVTSAPLLVSKVETNAITFIQLDYRFDPKLVTWNVYNKQDNSPDTSTNTTFELTHTTSNSKCIEGLTNTQLNTDMLTFTDATFSTPITEVQHAFDGKWTLFSDAKSRAFKRYTFKDLIKKDPSLCNIINLPNGYYANRDSNVASWISYLHEERIKTDSSLITKKAFKHDNSYRVFNELKNSKKTYYLQYSLDQKIIREKGMYINGKEAGTWTFYDENGTLIKTEEKGN
ncbi:hypothetical protein [Olleya sp. YS]|uniref:hypothetical protein n=1 Tax=Olleya sp. YS TaxID=3028318 RepID=UPI0024343CDB|nr:hypothetical protein [Olleya sp. YS]WGD35962.1 hypothetical protein Ollyesu_05990 [Olleya sp. YS]